ncbi:PKD domain-containing protein [Maribellus sp. YY47]|uniref:PKD domain-containing protein n=1 Tax=Maribellus sp. YY47 TaxID=2929486 RepID=UPI00200120F1|nr:PKD domain-containing protein [Maribellus sp. YY47]MCK3686369.1 PKD domain-containing protein [Maribellus sp. YY47]
MAKKLIFILIFQCIIQSIAAKYADPCKKSTEGTDFWFGFMESRNYQETHYLEITVTAREATTFSIAVGEAANPYNQTHTISANSSVQVTIPWDLAEATGSEQIQSKGIHLFSEKPVNVYALNWCPNSADVAVIFPTESLGTEYFAMCYDAHVHENNNGGYGNGRNSQFLIVASVDSTRVMIIPSKETDQKIAAGDTINIILRKGEVYQVQSKNFDNNTTTNQGDLTGSYISSDKPVAFYSGSLATTVPATSGTSAWDHLYEQVPPIHAWGREFFAVPLKSREQDRYRIMAAVDNTVVHITNRSPITLNRGEYKEIVLYHNEPSRIYSDHPILVAQYSQSQSVDKDFTGKNGDPFMIILSSTTQSKNDVTFVAYDSDQIQKYYVNIVTLTSEVDNIRFNGTPISNEFTPFPESNYSYAQKAISRGTYHIHNVNEDRGFLAYVYGFGGVESYGYGVGFNLDLVLDLGESINFDGDTLLLCYGESKTLDAGPYFDTYNWNTGDYTEILTVNSAGKYKVKATTIDGCELEDSVYVYVSHPETELGFDSEESCYPYSLQLNGNDGFNKYVWQNTDNDTLSIEQFFTADQTGEYRLTVYDKYNCSARDTMNLVVYPVPQINIYGEELICGSKRSALNVEISGTSEEIWNYDGSYTWKSDNAALSFTNTQHKSADIEVSEWGKYVVYYELITTDGCIKTDTFNVSFQPTPTSEFIYVDDPNDKCKGYSREVKYNGNASPQANFYWDYGGAKLIDSLDWDNFIVSIGAYNTHPYLTLFVEENGCWSDTTSSLLGANPDFVLETQKAWGCDSFTVSFKGELNVEDALLFEWDFGDGSPLSIEKEVDHFYSDTGFYDVSLLITNRLSGCQIGFQIDSMIKVFPTPTAEIIADTSTCHPDSAEIIYANAIDSSICFWSFEGAHQSDTGNDTISMILDEPFGKAILRVDEFGCVSQPAEVLLKRKPRFDISTVDEEGCQPVTKEIKASSHDNFIDFTWLTDTLPYPVGNSQLYYFPDSGRFDISLIASSQETGCRDTLVKKDWIRIHPKPVAAFEVDYPVAFLEHSAITYSNHSENADFYSWDFGDKTSSFDKNPIHTFTNLGEFISLLIAESDFGCKDTTDAIIKILPFSGYTPNAFRPDSEISENRTFMPVGLGAEEDNFHLKIFDRWGQLVFESHSPNAPWDGNNRKGGKAPMGNYVWIAQYVDLQGYEHNQKGQVLLVR